MYLNYNKKNVNWYFKNINILEAFKFKPIQNKNKKIHKKTQNQIKPINNFLYSIGLILVKSHGLIRFVIDVYGT